STRVVRVGQPLAGQLAESGCLLGVLVAVHQLDEPNVPQRSQLVVDDAAIDVIAVELLHREGQRRTTPRVVTGQALGAAGEVPRLPPRAARRLPVLDGQLTVGAPGRD